MWPRHTPCCVRRRDPRTRPADCERSQLAGRRVRPALHRHVAAGLPHQCARHQLRNAYVSGCTATISWCPVDGDETATPATLLFRVMQGVVHGAVRHGWDCLCAVGRPHRQRHGHVRPAGSGRLCCRQPRERPAVLRWPAARFLLLLAQLHPRPDHRVPPSLHHRPHGMPELRVRHLLHRLQQPHLRLVRGGHHPARRW